MLSFPFLVRIFFAIKFSRNEEYSRNSFLFIANSVQANAKCFEIIISLDVENTMGVIYLK